jgi:hypothetical protein
VKLILGTEQQLTDLQAEQFTLGAPFSCYLKGDAWNEATLTVGRNTTAWQSVQYSESLGSHYIVHIDEFPFTDHTFQWYNDQVYVEPVEPVEGEEPQVIEYTELEQAILNRIPVGYETYTPKQYVSEVVIGNNYTVIDV